MSIPFFSNEFTVNADRLFKSDVKSTHDMNDNISDVICRKIISPKDTLGILNENSGSLSVESTYGEGYVFKIDLPK